MKPAVTVLMTSYNASSYIRETMESVLSQTFGDFEFLILDNASSDNTFDIVTSFSDPRIRLIRNPTNLGQTAALNLGLELSQADWIARIDADDMATPERLERQWRFVNAADPAIAVLGTQIVFIDSAGQQIKKHPMPTEEGDILWHLLFTSPVAHSAVFLRKTAALEAGKYNPRYRAFQDIHLWISLLKCGYRIANLDGPPLVKIRLHENSVSKITEGVWVESVEATRSAVGDLLGLRWDGSDYVLLNSFLSGNLKDLSSWRRGMKLAQNCYNVISEKFDVKTPYGKTMVRLAMASDSSWSQRFLLLKSAIAARCN